MVCISILLSPKRQGFAIKSSEDRNGEAPLKDRVACSQAVHPASVEKAVTTLTMSLATKRGQPPT